MSSAYEQTSKAVSRAKLCTDILWVFNSKVAYNYATHLKMYIDFDNGISIKLWILQDENCATTISFSVDFEKHILLADAKTVFKLSENTLSMHQ